ncbi:MAG: type II toxin-antitoxin system RelE/ParE family toxin [Chthoniobacterales bacterium]
MIRQVVFRPDAVEDIVEAAAWYEERSPGLATELIDEILLAADRAAANPELFRIIRAEGKIRHVLAERFPYRVFFSVVGEVLYVHAVLHGAQHGRRWRERL